MFTYFLQSELGGPIKIGKTKRSPDSRRRGCQTGNPESLIVIGTINGNHEGSLKRRFCADCTRPRGEWFHLSEQLLLYLKGKGFNPRPETPRQLQPAPLAEDHYLAEAIRLFPGDFYDSDDIDAFEYRVMKAIENSCDQSYCDGYGRGCNCEKCCASRSFSAIRESEPIGLIFDEDLLAIGVIIRRDSLGHRAGESLEELIDAYEQFDINGTVGLRVFSWSRQRGIKDEQIARRWSDALHT
jgi:hypothetical protein